MVHGGDDHGARSADFIGSDVRANRVEGRRLDAEAPAQATMSPRMPLDDDLASPPNLRTIRNGELSSLALS
jgi:hypothetical protein